MEKCFYIRKKSCKEGVILGTRVIITELEQAAKKIPENQIQNLIQKIKTHRRIFVYGTGRSGLMLKALAMRLMQIGLDAYVVGETTTPSVEKGDLLIAASASGETSSVCMTVQSAKKQGADLVVISASSESTLGKIQTPDITISSATKFSTSDASIQPLGSLFEQMLLIVFDAAILEMSQEDKGSNDDMAKRHASLE